MLAYAQRPANGYRSFSVHFSALNYQVPDIPCIVYVEGDSITITHTGTSKMKGNIGSILDKGILMQHKRTGNWIIAHSPKDADSDEIGGCNGSPTIIDFEKKVWTTCGIK
jgi:hypothetical protein